MRYATVCSGAEAIGPHWASLGLVPAFHAETDYHAANVLRYRYPTVPNYGDFTTIQPTAANHPDLLAGGTPCQDDSVAGLRRGDAGPDGHLAGEFVELAHQLGARWLLWENVAGALSTDGGRRFGAFLGALGQRGYGWAYRVLDAQYFGVPQKRRRVFVVGCLGDVRAAGAVLFEPESLRRDSTPRRRARAHLAGTLTAGAGASGARGRTAAFDHHLVAGPLTAGFGVKGGMQVDAALAHHLVAAAYGGGQGALDVSPALLGHGGRRDDYDTEALVMQGHGSDVGRLGSLRAGSGSVAGGVPFTHAFNAGRVRRLTEVECERLMGWPDDWTRWGTRPDGTRYELPAGARYRICGNGWVVPNATWIVERLLRINSLLHETTAP